MGIARDQVRNHEAVRARQLPPVESAGRIVVKGFRRTDRNAKIIMVEQQVLAIDRKSQVLVILVRNTVDEALEGQRILLDVVIRHEQLEHAEQAQLGIGNVKMAEEVEADVACASVLQDCPVYRRLRTPA